MRRLKENGTAEGELKLAIDELVRQKENLMQIERQSTSDVVFFRFLSIKFFFINIISINRSSRLIATSSIFLSEDDLFMIKAMKSTVVQVVFMIWDRLDVH